VLSGRLGYKVDRRSPNGQPSHLTEKGRQPTRSGDSLSSPRDGHSLLDFHSRSDQALPPRREVADRIANVSLGCALFDALLRADVHLAITDLEQKTTSPP